MDGRYRAAVLDRKFRTRVIQLLPEMATRFSQVAFFQSKGSKCGYFKAAVKLAVMDLYGKGFRVSDGSICSPEGEPL